MPSSGSKGMTITTWHVLTLRRQLWIVWITLSTTFRIGWVHFTIRIKDFDWHLVDIIRILLAIRQTSSGFGPVLIHFWGMGIRHRLFDSRVSHIGIYPINQTAVVSVNRSVLKSCIS